MKTALVVLIGLVSLSMCAGAHGQDPRKIEFRMQPGESVAYALHAETTTEYAAYMSRGTDKRTTVFKSDMRVLMRCVKLSPEGVVHAEMTYPDFSLETVMIQGGRMSKIVSDRDGARSYVDGKLEEELTWENLEEHGRPNLKKLFSSMIGLSFDRTGKVLDVKAPPGLSTRFTWVDVKPFFRHLVILPAVAIAPGAQWNEATEREIPQGPGPLSGKIMLDKRTYTYQGNETTLGRECARIRMVISSQPKESIPNLKEFKQTTEGWSLVSLDNGQLVVSELKLFQEMKGTPGGVKTEVKTTGQVRTSLVQPPAAEAASGEQKPPVDTK